MSYRSILKLALPAVVTLLTIQSAVGNPYIIGDPATPIRVSVLSDGTSVLGVDVRANALFAVYDPGFLGFVYLTDTGTPAPNSGIVTANFPALSEALGLVFDVANPIFNGNRLTLAAIGIPITTVTDPALAALQSPFTIDFDLVRSDYNPDTKLYANYYDSLAAPEPASGLASGLLAVGALAYNWRRRQRRA